MQQYSKVKIAQWKHLKDEFQIENSFEKFILPIPYQENIKVNECYIQRLYRKRTFLPKILGEWILIEEFHIHNNPKEPFNQKILETMQSHPVMKAMKKYGLKQDYIKIE